LNYDADFVRAGIPTERVEAQDFYRGFNSGWAAIEQGLDVRRKLSDTFLFDVILPDESDRAARVECFVIKAEAGAGKTVCMQRIAWLAATEADKICLFVRVGGRLRYDAIVDIAKQAKERVFLFVDDAGDNVASLAEVITRARTEGLLLTIVTAERQNEWNIACERLEPFVTSAYMLTYLSHPEINRLLDLLRTHGSLGNLACLTDEDRIRALSVRAGRQLLVALLETTRGVSFEEILVDEYRNITPESAQSLYLTVCVLNRLGIPVRAGLISRIHGIPFEEFRQRLFKPLEHVVLVEEDRLLRDHIYMARHSLIADKVFERILRTPNARFDEYVRVVGALNLAYSTDTTAFRQMVRGRTLLELFPDHTAAVEIFRIAMEVADDDPHVFHQRGIYEMVRPNGNLQDAHAFLAKARALAPSDLTVIHSLAELERKRAEAATNPLIRASHRNEARKLAQAVRDDAIHGDFGYHTLLKLQLDRLTELLEDKDSPDREIDRLLQEIEETLQQGLQRFPGSDYLLSAEADLGELLADKERARDALAAAFQQNRRSPFIAGRLARILAGEGKNEEALRTLEEALEANPGERRLHFSYAMLLRETDRGSKETILYHLQRSFTPGDRNFDAQFWFATYLYMKDDEDSLSQSRQLFRALWQAPLPYSARSRVRAVYVDDRGEPITFSGVLARKEASYGLITRAGHNDRVMVREDVVSTEMWESVAERQRLLFQIAFNFGGPIATDVRLL